MDQLFSWEYISVDAQQWWRSVPSNFNNRLHFHNVPISNEEGNDENPLTLIKDVVSSGDFVAFKLDVDTSSVELPIALSLLRNSSYYELVDEFFFELHYNCKRYLCTPYNLYLCS